ncbi:phosphoribosyltransferase family protein [Danxiaibacter flavus]|uniref:Phosphoribosyltransferase family protein n=1 Tax=Danxiaibacter flavus TaxID=3049108 RepID=A0ABV3ZEQ4_9BACT|nr:phosphoribosyltransferase family protein [Chitinophagaceae bacterium DXS]
MHFRDRNDAAHRLAAKLVTYTNQDGVVLAIPRGGVPVAFEIAKQLHFTLDLLMTKKIGHPRYPEYAIGAVGLEDSIIHEDAGLSSEDLAGIIAYIREELRQQYLRFMGNNKPAPLEDRIVIIADDGIATGRTILGTLPMIKRRHPGRLIIAVPVISPRALKLLQEQVDEVVYLHAPFSFQGVGRFYEDFRQVSDEDVLSLLAAVNSRTPPAY